MSPGVSMANMVMEAYARDGVSHAGDDLNVPLDYSLASIDRLEMIVARQHEMYAAAPIPGDPELYAYSKMWGAYLGEVIRRQHGGDWSISGDGQGSYILTLPGGVQLSPTSQVLKRIVEGESDSLDFYYLAVLESMKRSEV